jgi:hypothetical protein
MQVALSESMQAKANQVYGQNEETTDKSAAWFLAAGALSLRGGVQTLEHAQSRACASKGLPVLLARRQQAQL